MILVDHLYIFFRGMSIEIFCLLVGDLWGSSLMAQQAKNPPAMQQTQEIQVRSLGQEDFWRRVWQLTPAFLPRESHGQRILAGYSPKDCKELDNWAEWLSMHAGRRAMKHFLLSESMMPGSNMHYCSPLFQVGDGQGGPACCVPWGHKESDMTEWLNWTELKLLFLKEEMATHSSILAWRIQWTEDPSRL